MYFFKNFNNLILTVQLIFSLFIGGFHYSQHSLYSHNLFYRVNFEKIICQEVFESIFLKIDYFLHFKNKYQLIKKINFDLFFFLVQKIYTCTIKYNEKKMFHFLSFGHKL